MSTLSHEPAPRGEETSPPAPTPTPALLPEGAAASVARRPGEPERALPRVLRGTVKGRSEVTAGTIAGLALVEEESEDAVLLRRLLDRRRTVLAALYVAELRDLAALWDEKAGEEDGDVNAAAVGMVLRSRIGRATTRQRDAFVGVTDLPRCLGEVETGALPTEWFDHVLRSVRDLTAEQRHLVDEQVAGWQLDSLSPDRFWTLLRTLVLWFGRTAADGSPESKRDVRIDVNADATACLSVTGPIPEILGLGRRLDVAARAVQDAQRRALERIAAGAQDVEIPWDVDGDVAAAGRHMTLGAIRYLLLTRSTIDTAGVPVPRMPLRLNLVVPVLSLLGVSDAPGTLDGTISVPAEMARALCGDAPVWHRVLTDPISGEFLPVAAQQYRPSRAMLEHVRLVDTVCAVPGCTRTLVDAGEVDHIEEFDHLRPRRGGPTAPENLHGLCRRHHAAKTRGRLDPERTDGGRSTRWSVDGTAWSEVTTNRDLVTATLAAEYQRLWDLHLDEKRYAPVWERMERECCFPTPEEDAMWQRWHAFHEEHYATWDGPPGVDPPPPEFPEFQDPPF